MQLWPGCALTLRRAALVTCLIAAGAAAQDLDKSTDLICCKISDDRGGMAPRDFCEKSGGKQTYLHQCRPPVCCRRGPRNTSFISPPELCAKSDGKAVDPEICFRRTVCCKTEAADGKAYHYFQRYQDKCIRRGDEPAPVDRCLVCCRIEKPDGSEAFGFIDLTACEAAGGSKAEKNRYCMK